MDKTLIQEGVETCSCCNGKGYRPANNLVLYEFCPKCKGKGRVDWVTNIVLNQSFNINNFDPDLYNLEYKLKQYNVQELIRRIGIEYMEMGVIVSVEIKNQDQNKFKTTRYQLQSGCLSLHKEF